MTFPSNLEAHLQTGVTTLCRCWSVERRDGVVLGFTDHDLDIEFENTLFRANTGLTARALQQSTGLSVDNTEAVGALSHDAVTEADIQAGRYDDADVRAWLVNWNDVNVRHLQFRGTLGEIQSAGGSFQAELRGLTATLNQPQGRVYQTPCPAILGDKNCSFDLETPGYFTERPVVRVEEGRIFQFDELAGFDARWFERGRLRVKSGAAKGLIGIVKNDRQQDGVRSIELWETLRAEIQVGDIIRLEAGCDKRAETCKLKFHNFLNFRGFPDIPGEDWLTSYPVKSGVNDGGSMVR